MTKKSVFPRKMAVEAEEWRREKEGQLKAAIAIHDALLRDARTELAELRKLQGDRLTARYGAEKPAEVASVMADRRQFLDRLRLIDVLLYMRACRPRVSERG